jgi:iron complex transport system permease protein
MPIEAASAGVLKNKHARGGALSSDDGFELTAGRYRALLGKRVLFLGAMATALAASLFADLVTGPSGLGASAFVTGILHPGRLDATDAAIIWNVRLPYAIMAALVGSALALSGAEMQTLLDNPLASPFTLGVSIRRRLGGRHRHRPRFQRDPALS